MLFDELQDQIIFGELFGDLLSDLLGDDEVAAFEVALSGLDQMAEHSRTLLAEYAVGEATLVLIFRDWRQGLE